MNSTISHKLRILTFYARLLLITIVIVGCAASTQPTATAIPSETLTLQINWVNDYSSLGFYAAEKHGHFATENLNVTIKGGGFTENGYIDATNEVASGSAQFGVASADSIIQARAQGKPLVGIAAIFQRSPLAIISLESAPIQRPQDLIGRRIAVADGGAKQLYTTMLNIHSIDPNATTTISRTTWGVEPLLDGSVDAMVGWSINEGVLIEEAGQKPTIMLMSDYGIDSYELVLFTTEAMIAEQPEVVKRMVQASLRGWQDVLDKPVDSVALVHAYDPTLDLEAQRRRLQAALPLLAVPGTPFGSMNPQFWTFTHQTLLDQKVLNQPIDIERAYSLQFLPVSQP